MPRSANWSTTRHRLPPLQAALESARATITLTNGSRLPRGLTGAIDFAATFAAGLAGAVWAGASWLKNVVATKLETTLSDGEYLYVFFTFASAGFAVVESFILLMLMMRSSLFTRSKKFRTE